jgi:N-acetylmuramoyl-L-alanine amidase
MAQKIVFLDAGHGGTDPGAVDGKQNDPIYSREATYNLDLVVKTKAALERCGVKVIASRLTDATLSLQKRAELANKSGASIFVSWHCNGGPDGATSRGIEVFNYYKSVNGAKLANAIYGRLDDVSPWSDRGVKEAGFYVLKYTKMPAALIEAGFINNTQEEAALASPTYRLALAEAAARGICDYLGVTYKKVAPTPAPMPTPTIPPISNKRTFLEARIHLDATDRAHYVAAAKVKNDFIVFYPTVADSFMEWPKGI